MRFQLIDQVLEHDEQRLRAMKTVTVAEEYLADHFPSFPVLPGVMMLETLVQAARLLIAKLEPAASPLVVQEVRNLRYGQMVRPGQALVVEVTIRKQDDTGWEFNGVGKVEDEVAVQGRFRLVPITSLSA